MTASRQPFGRFVMFGDTVEETRAGVTYRVRIEHDPHHSIDDDDTHREDRAHPTWEGAPDGAYERAMEARAAFLRGEWHYVGLIVSAHKGEWERDDVASLWGIEANYPGTQNEYLDVVADELIDEAHAELFPSPEDAMGGEITAEALVTFCGWLSGVKPDTFADLWAEFQGLH